MQTLLSCNIPTATALESNQNLNSESTSDLKEAADQFEAFFLDYILKTMKKSVQKGSLFSGGYGEDVMDDFATSQVTSSLSKDSPLGLSKMIMNEYSPRGLSAKAEIVK